MGKNSLHGVHLEIIAHGLDVGSHGLVETSNLNAAGGSLESVPSSKNDLSLLALGFASNNDSVGGVGRESIDVSSAFNFDKVSILKSN